MRFELPGIILFTERFDACVAFYRDLLALPEAFAKPGLVTLDLGGAYLMIESGGTGRQKPKPIDENPTILRFNVEDVDAAAGVLRRKGVDVEVLRLDWGVVGCFSDPDGNRCELKDHSASFQVLSRQLPKHRETA
ncbi:VOC family protein [Jeongeupia naejangsanensis]|uniref:VOC domain-containing protein n=1 Tax=Jeongeupia naejangsanensis TaxID=613195 RepID=A0ABS2BG72_9NEIS|nr:VOC family protein [Jeongeupia naejangsanensis]MBM3114613.1 hypothetical protein [Jeongeupia naejangsanensis]